MFWRAEAFNQDICEWDVNAEVFNQYYIGAGCDFSKGFNDDNGGSSIGFLNKPKKQILMCIITVCLVLTAF
jgi:hypothetical protein